jgi:hypothetical protein
MAFAFSALLLIAQAADPGPTIGTTERIAPETAAARAAACGLGQPTLRYDPELQSHILTVDAPESVSDAQLACVDRATSYYDTELPPTVQPRFDAIRNARFLATFRAEARAWLTERNLLGHVPPYVEGVTDTRAFASQVELMCGPSAKGALQSSYGPSIISPDWAKGMGTPPDPDHLEAFSCIINVTAVAGFRLGFIGNEATP